MIDKILKGKSKTSTNIGHRLDVLLMKVEQIDHKIERQSGKLADCAVEDYRMEIRMSRLRLNRIDYLVGQLGKPNDEAYSIHAEKQQHQVPLAGHLKLVKS